MPDNDGFQRSIDPTCNHFIYIYISHAPIIILHRIKRERIDLKLLKYEGRITRMLLSPEHHHLTTSELNRIRRSYAIKYIVVLQCFFNLQVNLNILVDLEAAKLSQVFGRHMSDIRNYV